MSAAEMRWPGTEGTPFDDWLTRDDHRMVEIDVVDDWGREDVLVLPDGERIQPGQYVVREADGTLRPGRKAKP